MRTYIRYNESPYGSYDLFINNGFYQCYKTVGHALRVAKMRGVDTKEIYVDHMEKDGFKLNDKVLNRWNGASGTVVEIEDGCNGLIGINDGYSSRTRYFVANDLRVRL
jgi:hypothetical protein